MIEERIVKQDGTIILIPWGTANVGTRAELCGRFEVALVLHSVVVVLDPTTKDQCIRASRAFGSLC